MAAVAPRKRRGSRNTFVCINVTLMVMSRLARGVGVEILTFHLTFNGFFVAPRKRRGSRNYKRNFNGDLLYSRASQEAWE